MFSFYSKDELYETNKLKKKAGYIGAAVIAASVLVFTLFAVNLKAGFIGLDKQQTMSVMFVSLFLPGIALIFAGNVFYKPVKQRAKQLEWMLSSEGMTDSGKLVSVDSTVRYIDWEPYVELKFLSRDVKGKYIERTVKLRADKKPVEFKEGEDMNYRTVGTYLVSCERI